MPSTRRSTRGSSSRQITPIPKPKKTKIAKSSPATKKQTPVAGRITTSRASRRSTSTATPVSQSKQSSPSPAPPQKRAYISDSDDDEVQALPKQRKIQESDDEADNDAGVAEEQTPASLEPSPSTISPEVPAKSSKKSKSTPKSTKQDEKNDLQALPARTRRSSTRQAAQVKREPPKKKRLPNKRIPEQWEEVINSKFRRPTRIGKKEQKPEPRKIATTKAGINDEEVEAEFSVVLLRPQADTCLSRIQFHQRPLQAMNECQSRLKRQVKHIELTYKTRRNAEGIAFNKVNALYDGVYRSESTAKSDVMLRQAVGFFKSDRFYLMPVTETFEMSRQIVRPIDIDIMENSRNEDSNFANAGAPPVLNPVRVRFARTETEWQRKRREQSIQYRQMLYDQDQWVNAKVNKEDVRTVYKKEIAKAKGAATMRKNVKLPLI